MYLSRATLVLPGQSSWRVRSPPRQAMAARFFAPSSLRITAIPDIDATYGPRSQTFPTFFPSSPHFGHMADPLVVIRVPSVDKNTSLNQELSAVVFLGGPVHM